MSRHPVQRLIVLLGFGLLAACGRSEAPAVSGDNSQLPAPGPTPAAEIAAPIEKQLANGLRVVVLPRAGSALVAAEFLLLSGSEVDPADRAGLADFTASLLTQGTKSTTGSRSASQLAAAAEALGGPLQAQAGWDATTVGITVTTPKLAAALDLLADVVRHPAFAEDEVERYRAQAIDSLRLSFSDPSDVAPLVAARIVHGSAPYGHPRLGTPASVQRITAGELRALHQRYYRPDKAVLVLTGGLEPDTGFALAAQVFGDWNAPAEALAVPPPKNATRVAPATITVIDQPDAGQAAVIAVLPLPERAAVDYYPGLVASNVLGGGYSSRLNSEIRIKRGLSYGASASYGVLRDGGAWMASVQTKNASAAEVVGLIRTEVAGLGADAVPADELTARKASYIGNYARRLETASGIAGLIAGRLAQGLPADEITRVINRVSAVDSAQVRNYATQHFQPEALRFVIVGDARQFAEALQKDGQRIDVIPLAELDLDAPLLRRPNGKR
ncbi:M16 family metallopeptidase [Nevskia ramosa]|uniref:M16 family metallopeptidase n=1 Tax=Nevskia ramosa TaxID=64002 RepID=UPI000686C73A|nr:pitrilysin family protein [Nevskia ramosa]